MRRFLIFFAAIILGLALMTASQAAEFHLNNGDIIKGTPGSFNADGVVFQLDIGGFSPRIAWGHFTQDSLKVLVKNPKGRRFAEPFIEVPIEVKEKQKAKKKEIVVRPVTRVERPEKSKFFASLGTPLPLTMIALLYGANLYAAFRVARFRERPVGLVCALGAIIPILGPILVLASPPAVQEVSHEEVSDHAPTISADVKKTTGPAPAKSGLGLAAHEKGGAPAGAGDKFELFKRGETTFNRRFFETKFAGFFRVVPNEAEKDLVLYVRTAKGDFIGKRISRIAANEMHVTMVRGGNEVMIPFGEVLEVQVRHKDAKA